MSDITLQYFISKLCFTIINIPITLVAQAMTTIIIIIIIIVVVAWGNCVIMHTSFYSAVPLHA